MSRWCATSPAALHAFRSQDLETVRRHLEQVQHFAPNHVARNGMAKIKQHASEIEYVRMACELAQAGKKLVAARRAIEAWRQLVDPALPEVQNAFKEVASGLRQAEELAARAAQAGAWRPAGRAQPLPQEPGHCGRPARGLAGLNRCPPDAPTNLECTSWVIGSASPGRRQPPTAWARSASPRGRRVSRPD